MSGNKHKFAPITTWLTTLLVIGVLVFQTSCTWLGHPSSETSLPSAQTSAGSDFSQALTTEPSALASVSVSLPELEGTASSLAKVTFGNRYSSEEDVALYLELFDELPPNYLTKAEAYDRGWVPEEGNLWEVTEEMSIGGDRFGNREGLLPDKSGRQYYEADVNYSGGPRNAERLVYSNDGLIYYTDDHYESFQKLYE